MEMSYYNYNLHTNDSQFHLYGVTPDDIITALECDFYFGDEKLQIPKKLELTTVDKIEIEYKVPGFLEIPSIDVNVADDILFRLHPSFIDLIMNQLKYMFKLEVSDLYVFGRDNNVFVPEEVVAAISDYDWSKHASSDDDLISIVNSTSKIVEKGSPILN